MVGNSNENYNKELVFHLWRVIEYIKSQIKKRRLEKGLDHSDITIDLGLTPGGYSKVETGSTELTIERLTAIAKILEVDITYFLAQPTTVNKPEETGTSYATKKDIEELHFIINRMKQEVAALKTMLNA